MGHTKQPNFLIVGAAKSGTTSLWHYLKQHPDVFMPVNKEPMFFASSYYEKLNRKDPHYPLIMQYLVTDLAAYRRLFEKSEGKKAVGEATATYLCHHDLVIPKVIQLLDDVKILMILRNPVDRAVSAYTFLLRDGEESQSLDKCLNMEEERMKSHWSMTHAYRGVGLYYSQVKAYMDNFSRVKVYLYEDLVRDAQGLVKQMFEFLEVDSSFSPDVKTRHNISGVPTKAWIHRAISKPNLATRSITPLVKLITTEPQRRKIVEGLRGHYLSKPEIPVETRGRLQEIFRDDILKLQDLIGRDLSTWLASPASR